MIQKTYWRILFNHLWYDRTRNKKVINLRCCALKTSFFICIIFPNFTQNLKKFTKNSHFHTCKNFGKCFFYYVSIQFANNTYICHQNFTINFCQSFTNSTGRHNEHVWFASKLSNSKYFILKWNSCQVIRETTLSVILFYKSATVFRYSNEISKLTSTNLSIITRLVLSCIYDFGIINYLMA